MKPLLTDNQIQGYTSDNPSVVFQTLIDFINQEYNNNNNNNNNNSEGNDYVTELTREVITPPLLTIAYIPFIIRSLLSAYPRK